MGFPGPLSDWQRTLDWIQCCSGTDPPAPHSQVSCYLSQIHMPVLLGDASLLKARGTRVAYVL